MTVIIGVNLSDKVYLAGDSRLSYEKDSKVELCHDNMQKVENLKDSHTITVASAGDAKFASFLLNRLNYSDLIIFNINDFRSSIEEWMTKAVDEYLTQKNNYPDNTFIFGGVDPNTKKIVSGEQIINMANAFTGGKGLIYVNSALQSAIKVAQPTPKKDIELDTPDTRLFSVQVTKNGIRVTDTKFGEFLIYGPEGLVKDDIGIKEIAKFEFDPSFRNNGSGMGNDYAALNAYIYSQAEKYKLSTVGGSVVVIANFNDGTSNILSGKVYMMDRAEIDKLKPDEPIYAENAGIINTIEVVDNDHVYREVDKERHKLIPVSKYIPDKSSKMLL